MPVDPFSYQDFHANNHMRVNMTKKRIENNTLLGLIIRRLDPKVRLLILNLHHHQVNFSVDLFNCYFFFYFF